MAEATQLEGQCASGVDNGVQCRRFQGYGAGAVPRRSLEADPKAEFEMCLLAGRTRLPLWIPRLVIWSPILPPQFVDVTQGKLG